MASARQNQHLSFIKAVPSPLGGLILFFPRSLPQTCRSSPPGLSCGRCPPSRWSAVFLSTSSNTWSASFRLRATPNYPPDPEPDRCFVCLRCCERSSFGTSFNLPTGLQWWTGDLLEVRKPLEQQEREEKKEVPVCILSLGLGWLEKRAHNKDNKRSSVTEKEKGVTSQLHLEGLKHLTSFCWERLNLPSFASKHFKEVGFKSSDAFISVSEFLYVEFRFFFFFLRVFYSRR